MHTQTDAQFSLPTPSGKLKDSREAKNICNNFAIGKCKNNRCDRIHIVKNHQSAPAPVPQQNSQTQSGGQGNQQPQACKFFATNGRCKFGDGCSYSHDLQVIYNAFNRDPPGYNTPQDTRMGDAASNGDNAHTQTQGNQNQACKFEADSGWCKNKKCKFVHTNPRSEAFKQNQQRSNQGGGQGGQWNQTYNADVHGPPQFAQPPNRTEQWVQQQNQGVT